MTCYICQETIIAVNGPQTVIHVNMDGKPRLLHKDCYEAAQDAYRDAPQEE